MQEQERERYENEIRKIARRKVKEWKKENTERSRRKEKKRKEILTRKRRNGKTQDKKRAIGNEIRKKHWQREWNEEKKIKIEK